MSKQVTKTHVRDAVHMYLVNLSAMLTYCILFVASLLRRIYAVFKG
jgi:hypothetical protein